MAETQWVAVDWGTSNVRAWGIAADGSQTFAASSDKGMGKIARADYPGVLDTLVGDRLGGVAAPIDVVVCGMAGARQGWMEAPYLDAPANLNALSHGAVRP
ncbi:MAG TPA: 2-dehydro-3-deoxygalactonokinase, partial [Devosia sp.]|nr:2-dehydro-3-deoxygalactonokinase [Devosia sp.]